MFIEVWRMKGIMQEEFVGCPLSQSLGKHQYKGTNTARKPPKRDKEESATELGESETIIQQTKKKGIYDQM